jgi:hypothetical protein
MEVVMNKLFSELSVGQEFKVPGSDITYRKIDNVKVSCCKSYNAEDLANTVSRTFFAPGTSVITNG